MIIYERIVMKIFIRAVIAIVISIFVSINYHRIFASNQEIPDDVVQTNVRRSDLRQCLNLYGTTLDRYGAIEPDFIKAVLFSSKQHCKILEVGAAFGQILQKILKFQGDVISSGNSMFYNPVPISYTIVEMDKRQVEIINMMILEQNKIPENKIQCFAQDIRNFLEKSRKKNLFDLVYIGFVLHYLNPIDKLSVLIKLREQMNNESKMFITVPSIMHNRSRFSVAHKEAYLSKWQSGDLWPGYHFDDDFSIQYISELQARNLKPSDCLYNYLHLPALKQLLKAIGFAIVTANEYKDIGRSMHYVGVIAKKTEHCDGELIKQYQIQAEKKVQELAEFKKEYSNKIDAKTSENRELIPYIQKNYTTPFEILGTQLW